MPPSKALQRLFVQGKGVWSDGVKQFFGTDEDISQRYDAAAGQFVQRDEGAGLDQLQIADGNDLTDELEASGLMELVVGNLLNFDPTAVLIGTGANRPAAGTADRVYIRTDATGGPVIERDTGASWDFIGASPGALKDGGAAALDVADLSGAAGTLGQVPQSDGSSVSWATVGGRNDPVFGPGVDGAITRSSNANENGFLQPDTYAINSGVTMTVSGGILVVSAQAQIDVDGTINGDGTGGAGGAGGDDFGGDNGGGGESSYLVPNGSGGSGGSPALGAGSGGNGGNGDTASPLAYREIFTQIGVPFDLLNNRPLGGAGGGGGGEGYNQLGGNGNGGNGSPPGGGGAGGDWDTGSSSDSGVGGDGGDGGALVILMAPTINITGTITLDGTNGSPGQDNTAAGGGGGGGCGGAIILIAEDLNDSSATYSMAPGSGALGGSGTADGGDGADGATGWKQEVLA